MKPTHQDAVALQQLLAFYTHTLDYGNVDDMDHIWTADCVFQVDNPQIRVEGVSALKEMLRSTRAGYPHVRHVVSNSYVDWLDPDAPTQHSYLQIFDVEQLKITMFARYSDRCVRTEQGWRIAARLCSNG
jgi:SnoaL-like domain